MIPDSEWQKRRDLKNSQPLFFNWHAIGVGFVVMGIAVGVIEFVRWVWGKM